jgi:uncharacterized protein YwgA
MKQDLIKSIKVHKDPQEKVQLENQLDSIESQLRDLRVQELPQQEDAKEEETLEPAEDQMEENPEDTNNVSMTTESSDESELNTSVTGKSKRKITSRKIDSVLDFIGKGT